MKHRPVDCRWRSGQDHSHIRLGGASWFHAVAAPLYSSGCSSSPRPSRWLRPPPRFPPHVEAPPSPAANSTREPGNGPERNEVAAVDPAAAPSQARVQTENLPGTPGQAALSGAAPKPGRPGVQQGYPRQTQLRVYPQDPTDRAIKLGLMPYDGIAPALNALQARSDRVSAEVVGESTLGRDLYLVTVTAPEDRRGDQAPGPLADADRGRPAGGGTRSCPARRVQGSDLDQRQHPR